MNVYALLAERTEDAVALDRQTRAKIKLMQIRRHPEYRKTYQVWHSMIRRCYNMRCESYKSYGAKGVTVCDRWRKNFLFFLQDMGFKPAGYSIERKDPRGNYEPNNCEWIPVMNQQLNKRQ